MIQFNLLPDIKLEFIKARRLKRLVMLISASVTSFAIAITICLFLLTNVWQAHQINNLTHQITKSTSDLKGIKGLNQVLTIQNQLNSLPAIDNQKPVTSRILTYLPEITPNNVSISAVDIHFDTGNSMTLTGNADSIQTINKFVDTLKFTTFTLKGDTAKTPAFTQVVLSSFTYDPKASTYVVDFKYDPALFDATKTLTLTVPPNFITTRSQVDKPNDLFVTQPTTTKATK